MNDKKEKRRPKYNVLQNVGWMIARAWRKDRGVLGYSLLIPTAAVAINLAQLFIAPAVLGKVETVAPLEELLGTILFFSVTLFFLQGFRAFMETRCKVGLIEVRSEITRDIDRKSCTTSYSNILDPKFGEERSLADEATYSNWAATEKIWKDLSALFQNVVGFGIYLALLSHLEPVLLLVVIATGAVSFFITTWTTGWSNRHKEEWEKGIHQLNYVEKTAKNRVMAKDVRIFGLADWLTELYDKALELYASFVHRRAAVVFWGNLADMVFAFARNGVAYFYLIRMTLEGGLSAAEFLLYFSAFSGFSSWIIGILKQVNFLQKESIELSVVREFLDWPEPFRFEGGVPIPDLSAGCELALENVSYRYPEAAEDTIKNISLPIHPGEKLAIVGLNGAGKTTLVKLLCGLLDPTEGRVLLNGVDIRALNRREYYKLLSAVFQDFSLINITLAETVAQNVEGIDRGRVADCLDKAGLTPKLESLPGGLDTHVGREVYEDGVLFSGGETQRLMLARALYKNGPLLMLDEPTAALDPIAENDIYMKYNEMTQGKTSVFISHRLASTRFCDRILFLENGVIAQEGTHESLLAQGGGYADLFEVQSRYYREGKDF